MSIEFHLAPCMLRTIRSQPDTDSHRSKQTKLPDVSAKMAIHISGLPAKGPQTTVD